MKKLKYINLGCGSNYKKEWTNLDFIGNEFVIQHNLLDGIPFPDNSFEFLYHSHVLEHFPKSDAPYFIQEAYRVLKKGGIIRIAIPDLERIAKEYLKNLDRVLKEPKNEIAKANYDWITLEMYDQTVRNKTGGEMARALLQETLFNEDYIFDRIGNEAKRIRSVFLKQKNETKPNILEQSKKLTKNSSILRRIKNKIKNIFFKEEIERYNKETKYFEIGKFRSEGEIHQWMYDRFSVKRLLEQAGFKEIEVKTAITSYLSDWDKWNLDIDSEGNVKKPDSLFIEAKK